MTSAGTRIHPKHKIPFTVNGWRIWNSTKGGFNWSNTVENSQQSAVIQSPFSFDHFISRRTGCSRHTQKEKEKKKTAKDLSLGGRARQRLCPTNCCYLWYPLWSLTTLMIVVFVYTLLFSFLASNFSKLPLPPLSSPSQHSCPSNTHTCSVSWRLPYSLHMLSLRNGCLMICLHRSCRE